MKICGGNVLNYNENNVTMQQINNRKNWLKFLCLCFFWFGDEYDLDMKFLHVNVAMLHVEQERKHSEDLNTIYYKLK